MNAFSGERGQTHKIRKIRADDLRLRRIPLTGPSQRLAENGCQSDSSPRLTGAGQTHIVAVFGPRPSEYILEKEIVTKLDRLTIRGPAGNLEALLEWDPAWAPRQLAIVCHPHPLYGGTMHNKVVFRAAKAAIHLGIPALRFNFRGVGQSGGDYAAGIGERDDALAVLNYLATRFPGIPVAMMGFSFGSVVALAVGAADPRVNALVGIGLPADSADFSFLMGVRKPKLLVQGTDDRFGSRENVEKLFSMLDEPKHLRFVESADHFLTGKLHELQMESQEFLLGVVNQLQ